MQKNCYIVIHSNYAEGEDACAFYDKNTAMDNIHMDMDAVENLLKEQGYPVEVQFREDFSTVYVPGSDIYYEWTVYESTIE